MAGASCREQARLRGWPRQAAGAQPFQKGPVGQPGVTREKLAPLWSTRSTS